MSARSFYKIHRSSGSCRPINICAAVYRTDLNGEGWHIRFDVPLSRLTLLVNEKRGSATNWRFPGGYVRCFFFFLV